MSWKHIPAFVIVVFLTFAIHEAAHFLTGVALGNEMWVRLNSAGPVADGYAGENHAALVSIAGPAVTLLQGLIAFFFVMRRQAFTAFIFLFSALMMRVLAAAVSMNNPNDEMRFGEWLGVGPWTVFGVTIGLLLVLTVFAGLKLRLAWKSWLGAWIFTSASIGAVIFAEPYLPMLGA